MKAITLYQPHASLMLVLDPALRKHNETRSWRTDHRGPLAIHASKNNNWLWMAEREPFKSALASIGILSPLKLPMGAVLGTVNVIDCVKISTEADLLSLEQPELSFGDYSIGRYFWRTTNPKPFATPIPTLGARQLWNWTPPEGLLDGQA